MDNTRKRVLIVIVVCKFFLYMDCISFKKYDFKNLRCEQNDTTFLVDNVPSPIACGLLCHNSNQCTTFIYEPDMLRCTGCRRAVKSYIRKGFVQFPSKCECPYGWVKNKDSCYYMHKKHLNHSDGENFCRQLDAHSVHLETQDENTFVKGLLWNQGDPWEPYWIGMTPNDLRNSGLDTAVPVEDFVDFCDPNKSTREDKCALFYQPCDFKWHTYPCYLTPFTLCEV